MSGLRTPLARARGMGSAKHGVGHFIAQRTTAAALVILVLWGVSAALRLRSGDYDLAAAWLHSPINLGFAALLALAAFWHMSLGMRTVIEDYIGRPSTKAILLILNVFVCWGGAALTILSLLKVALGAGVSI